MATDKAPPCNPMKEVAGRGRNAKAVKGVCHRTDHSRRPDALRYPSVPSCMAPGEGVRRGGRPRVCAAHPSPDAHPSLPHADCTELFLGNRGLRHLEGFDKLKNLEVLFVNGNQLERVTDLEGNFRLRELYVHVSRPAPGGRRR